MLGVVTVLGVGISNLSREEAIAIMESWIDADTQVSRSVFIVNAHTLNLACEDESYRSVLNGGSIVFGDGTGVRMAARQRNTHMVDNLVGTDLIPDFISANLIRERRYFLLGGQEGVAESAAARLRQDYPDICIVGHHKGFLHAGESDRVVEMVNHSKADMLLVAMGNPLQERWISDHLSSLRVPVSIGVGGLFDHWAGNLRRAPLWVRRLGIEWMQILLQQPGRKWKRYLLGNPKFLLRSLRSRNADLAEGAGAQD